MSPLAAGAVAVDGALPEPALAAAERDAVAVAHLLEEGLSVDDDGASGAPPTLCFGTFWWPLGAAPRNGCEAACNALAAVAAPAGASGAEWWVQDVAPDEEPKGCHTDCDVTFDAATGASLRRHPAVSSVLYLGACDGGGTAVFAQAKHWGTSGEDDGALEPSSPSAITEVAVCFPRRGRLLTFPGNQVHRVLRSPQQRADRLTLLMNWWLGPPPGGARPLPLAWCGAADGHRPPTPLQGPCGDPLCPVPATRHVVECSFADHAAEWAAGRLPAALAAATDNTLFLVVYVAPGGAASVGVGVAAGEGGSWWGAG